MSPHVYWMAVIKNISHHKCWWGGGEEGTLGHCWWACHLVQPPRKTVWGFLKKKWGLPCDPAIPLLGIHVQDVKSVPRQDSCPPIFVAASFTIAKAVTETERDRGREWSIIQPWQEGNFVIWTWMNLDGITVGETSQTEKDKYHVVSLICAIFYKKSNS